jgi:hypothetical protein
VAAATPGLWRLLFVAVVLTCASTGAQTAAHLWHAAHAAAGIVQQQHELVCISYTMIKTRSTNSVAPRFLAVRQQALNTSYWQILQIAPTGRPGELRVWALVKGEMHALSVNVYRKFYVNRRTPGEKRC